jgi:PII-like signaling protein
LTGPKERDNKDKSLHGLMVALAMAGVIAGSVILFAYASSDSVPDGTPDTADEPALQPERPVIAEIVDEPANAEEIEYVDGTADTERLTFVDATTETEEEIQTNTEAEMEESTYTSEDEGVPTSEQSGEQEEKDDLQDDFESDEPISKRLLNLLDDVIDTDEKPDKGKGKGHKGDG